MSDKQFNEAKQLYLEKYGDAVVTNNYLKIAVAPALLGRPRSDRPESEDHPHVSELSSVGHSH